MRFSAPRSLSPSPTRTPRSRLHSKTNTNTNTFHTPTVRSPQRSSTFGLHSESESDDSRFDSDSDDDDALLEPKTDYDSESSPSSSSSDSDSFCYASESEVPPVQPKSRKSTRSQEEQRFVDDTVAAIRLRTRHHDPYEEWERQTRKDAFRTAQKHQTDMLVALQSRQDSAHKHHIQHVADLHAFQVNEVQSINNRLAARLQEDEKRLRDLWSAQVNRDRNRLEAVIKLEEDRVRARLEAERKRVEEEERKRKEEEEKRQKEEEERESQRREEEEAQKKRAAEEAEARQKLEQSEKLDKEEAERRKREEEAGSKLGFSTAEDDWKHARETLKKLKEGPMKTVKGNKELKSQWSQLRRQITPKVGQLTNDQQSIARISNSLLQILRPAAPHSPDIYHALLSSLAKAILLQAETEVTAEKRSAGPLAQVAANLLLSLPEFDEILFAKLVQRAGGWPIPTPPPARDADGTPWPDTRARAKASGYREGEAEGDYGTRVGGLLRVYFHILCVRVEQPLGRMFQLPRYWAWFARMLGEAALLETGVAPAAIYAALDVFGLEARSVWGQQWVKVLSLLYEGVTTGLGGGKLIGGESAEGKAARVRVQLEVERIMKA